MMFSGNSVNEIWKIRNYLEIGVWEAEDECSFGGMVQHGRCELVQ